MGNKVVKIAHLLWPVKRA